MLETLVLSLHITRRNWTVYRKDLLANISPTIADAVLLMVSLGAGLGAYVQGGVEGRSYLQYLAPGITVGTALFTSFFESSYGFFVRMSYENVFKAMLTTPIGVREVVIGEMIWVGLKGAVMCSCVGVFLALFGLMESPALLPLVTLTGFLIALPCGALGLIATSLVKNINQFQSVYSFLIAPLYFLSGIFYPVSQMPQALQYLSALFPLTHGVTLCQAIFWNENVPHALMTVGPILLLQSVILCGIAYRLIRKKLVT